MSTLKNGSLYKLLKAPNSKEAEERISLTGYKIEGLRYAAASRQRKYMDNACVVSVDKSGKSTRCSSMAFRRTGEVLVVHVECQTLACHRKCEEGGETSPD